MAINKSFLPNASRFLENNKSNEKSFEQAVMVDVSETKFTIGKGFLLIFGFSLTKNSAAKCCASAADPPFPQINILLPFFSDKYIFLIEILIFF